MKAMVLYGTRPEIIKLAPVIRAFQPHQDAVELVLVSTGQHREFTDQMSAFFGIRSDYELDVMEPRQTLAHVVSAVIEALDPILEREAPDVMIVQGDTASSTAGALAASFRKVQVAHVEAGLRTSNKLSPFPEEINRRVTGVVADWHFAPTEGARTNLLREGQDPNAIHVTGNTVIDAMYGILAERASNVLSLPRESSREILLTLHRRESFGEGIMRVCQAARRLVALHEDLSIILPVHWNPSVRAVVTDLLGDAPRVRLVSPLPYPEFLTLLARCDLVMTDSGGLQEEAPALGKPVLVLRQETERPEAIEAGVAKLVGTRVRDIVENASRLLDDKHAYREMARNVSPFGDGRASERIVRVLMREIAGSGDGDSPAHAVETLVKESTVVKDQPIRVVTEGV